MTKQEAAAMLVQLYADYSTLCDKYGWISNDGMSEAVAIAVQSLREVEMNKEPYCNCGAKMEGVSI